MTVEMTPEEAAAEEGGHGPFPNGGFKVHAGFDATLPMKEREQFAHWAENQAHDAANQPMFADFMGAFQHARA